MKNTKALDHCPPRPYRLKNTIQHYPWGSRNAEAFIARLLGIIPDGDQAFAELWMGAHPKAPSLVIDPERSPQTLTEWIADNPGERLSLNHSKSLAGGLPYLFKVLSADQALSIQAHPNKSQAEALHQRDPQHYPDSNHKPEIAIAIDHLDALIGFISNEEFKILLKSTPELDDLISESNTEILNLRTAVLKLLEMSQDHSDAIESCISALFSRLKTKEKPTKAEGLFLKQSKLSGKQDIGLIFLFFLNRVHLKAGEAVFLPPGVPHAYLKGNIIECMANSDNVVRLGLTEKFCDALTLSEILVFDEQTDFRVPGSNDGKLHAYLSPTKEFTVKSLELLAGELEAFTSRSKLTLFLVLEGEISLRWSTAESSSTYVYRRGNSFITPANLIEFTLQAKNNSKLYLVEIP